MSYCSTMPHSFNLVVIQSKVTIAFEIWEWWYQSWTHIFLEGNVLILNAMILCSIRPVLSTLTQWWRTPILGRWPHSTPTSTSTCWVSSSWTASLAVSLGRLGHCHRLITILLLSNVQDAFRSKLVGRTLGRRRRRKFKVKMMKQPAFVPQLTNHTFTRICNCTYSEEDIAFVCQEFICWWACVFQAFCQRNIRCISLKKLCLNSPCCWFELAYA